MASLSAIIKELGEQAQQTGKIANRVLKIKGIKRIVVQLNATPTNNGIRYSMTIHSQNNFKKQIGITADDYGDLLTIANFLQKYKELLDEYVKFTPRGNNSVPREEEVDDEEVEEKHVTKKASSSKSKNVEDEF